MKYISIQNLVEISDSLNYVQINIHNYILLSRPVYSK